jgi:tripartite-type tricarboxylate transporter receptor subunit TctC
VPEAVQEKVNADVNRLLAQPAFLQRLAATGFDAVGGSRAEATRFVTAELQRWGEVVRALDISLD